jgi:hypothetical protein
MWQTWPPFPRRKPKPKPIRCLGPGMLCFPFCLSVCILFLASSLPGQLGRSWNMKGVKYAEFYEDLSTGRRQTNRLKGLLKGAEGQLLSNEVLLIQQMQLDYYHLNGQTNMVATAPLCLFDYGTRVAWSTGRLDLVGLEGAVRLRGYQGFEVRMTNNTMILSNRVRTVIRRELLKQQTP